MTVSEIVELEAIPIDIGTTNIVVVDLVAGTGTGYSSDTFTAELRVGQRYSSTLVATFSVDATGIADDELVLTLDNSATVDITAERGWMDVLRTSGGEPYRLFPDPVPVEFRHQPTDPT